MTKHEYLPMWLTATGANKVEDDSSCSSYQHHTFNAMQFALFFARYECMYVCTRKRTMTSRTHFHFLYFAATLK